MKKFTNQLWITECKTCIMEAFPVLGKEYIDEAEHQDGAGYWAQFESISSVLADVKMYHSCSDDYQLALTHFLDLVNHDYADIIADDDNQPDDVKANFRRGLLIANETLGRIYFREDRVRPPLDIDLSAYEGSPCATCECNTCYGDNRCVECRGCAKGEVLKNTACKGVRK